MKRNDSISNAAKKIGSLLIICSLFVHCLGRLGVTTYFFMNRTYIAEELCINRNEPAVDCEGSCYLNGMLEKVDEQERNIPEHFTQVKEIHLFYSFTKLEIPHTELETPLAEKWPLFQENSHYSFYQNSIFQPPRA